MDDVFKQDFEDEFGSEMQKIGYLFQNKNFDDALINCLKLEEKYPFSGELFFMIARIYKTLNEIDLAEQYYNKVLSINPDHPDTLNNLGNISNAKGNPEDAITLFKKVILLRPTAPQPYSNISQSYLITHNYDQAIKFAKKAIELDPKFIDAFNNLIKSQIKNNFYSDAIETVSKGLEIEPNNDEMLKLFSDIIKYTPFLEYDFDLDNKIELLFRNKKFGQIFPNLLLRIEKHPYIDTILLQLENKLGPEDLKNLVNKLIEIPFFMEIISSGLNSSIKIERLLTNLRREFLYNFEHIKNTKNITLFQMSLTAQCFNNQFVFFKTEKEIKIIEKLEKQIANKVNNNQLIPSLELLSLGSYKQISDYSWARSILCEQEINSVFKLIISEPLLEKTIKPLLTKITNIEDETSQLVEEQYSDAPYPRWRYTPDNKEVTLDLFVKTKKLKLNNKIESLQNPLQILVAGCGTGIQSIAIAQQFPRSNILAIDLSKSSLAFALRKTKEMGINNINYVHGDILELSYMYETFDVIHCTGVLHHMKHPLTGLECLINTLRKNGLMKLGLYSNIAREEINKVRDLINKENIAYTDESLKSFRKRLINNSLEISDEFNHSIDFFSLSGFRDLYFNVQETQYSIPKIKEIIHDYKLNFCGFDFSHDFINYQFKNMFSENDSEYLLDNWNQFEKRFKNTFFNMYQFWVQK